MKSGRVLQKLFYLSFEKLIRGYLTRGAAKLADPKLLLVLIIGFTTLIYTFILTQKHIHFQTFAWDTSVFDQQIYLASRLKAPFSSLHGINSLADHFHPLLLIMGGVLYAVWNDPRSLFFLQSLTFSLSALPLYLIAKHFLERTSLKDSHTSLLSLGLCVMYLYSVSAQAMTLDEIHDDVFSSLPILFAIYFLFKNNMKGFWLSFIWLLLTKEEYGLFGPPLGVYLWLRNKNLKQALAVAILGLVVFFILIKSVMPTLGGQKYPHFLKENEPAQIMTTFIKNPSYFVTKFFDDPKKQKTWTISLTSYGLLPLFAPLEMILPVSALAIRFYDDTAPCRFEFNNHYASPLIPILAVAAVSGLTNILCFLVRSLKQIDKNPKMLTLFSISFILGTAIFQDIIFHGPINSLLKSSFYEILPWQKDANALIRQVPNEVSLASQNSLLPHLSQRERFYLLPEIDDAEYIAVDLTEGPNKFAAYNVIQIRDVISQIIQDKSYRVIWKKNNALLLQRR